VHSGEKATRTRPFSIHTTAGGMVQFRKSQLKRDSKRAYKSVVSSSQFQMTTKSQQFLANSATWLCARPLSCYVAEGFMDAMPPAGSVIGGGTSGLPPPGDLVPEKHTALSALV
jgi:hypothetical protein